MRAASGALLTVNDDGTCCCGTCGTCDCPSFCPECGTNVLTSCGNAKFVIPTFDYGISVPTSTPVGSDAPPDSVTGYGVGFSCPFEAKPFQISVSGSGAPPDLTDWSSVPSYATDSGVSGLGAPYSISGIKRSYTVNTSNYTFDALSQAGVSVSANTTFFDATSSWTSYAYPGSPVGYHADATYDSKTFYDFQEISGTQNFAVDGISRGVEFDAGFSRHRLVYDRATVTETVGGTTFVANQFVEHSYTTTSGDYTGAFDTTGFCNDASNDQTFANGGGTATASFGTSFSPTTLNGRDCPRFLAVTGSLTIPVRADNGERYDFESPPTDPDTDEPIPPVVTNVSYSGRLVQTAQACCELMIMAWGGTIDLDNGDTIDMSLVRVGPKLYVAEFDVEDASGDLLQLYVLTSDGKPTGIVEVEQTPTPHMYVLPDTWNQGPPFGFCYGDGYRDGYGRPTYEPAYGSATFTSHSISASGTSRIDGDPTYACDS